MAQFEVIKRQLETAEEAFDILVTSMFKEKEHSWNKLTPTERQSLAAWHKGIQHALRVLSSPNN